MDTINCRSDKEKITVGEHIILNCSGEVNTDFSVEKSVFKLAEDNKYVLKVIKAKRVNSNELILDFTVYAPGSYKLSDLIISDGLNEVSLSGSEIKVESVIKPTPDGKPPQPFGALLPIGISTPLQYYVILLAILLSVVIYGFFNVRRIFYYKRLKEKLKDYDSPVTPDTQFYKAIRRAEKSDYPLDELEKAFRIYNIRTYQLPMFDLSNERILKYFKRNYPQCKSVRSTLLKLLEEFEEMRLRKKDLTVTEKQEFISKLFRYVEAQKGLIL